MTLSYFSEILLSKQSSSSNRYNDASEHVKNCLATARSAPHRPVTHIGLVEGEALTMLKYAVCSVDALSCRVSSSQSITSRCSLLRSVNLSATTYGLTIHHVTRLRHTKIIGVSITAMPMTLLQHNIPRLATWHQPMEPHGRLCCQRELQNLLSRLCLRLSADHGV